MRIGVSTIFLPVLISLGSPFIQGCHHRMLIISQPDGVQVYQNKKLVGSTPYDISFWWVPFRQQEIVLRAKGHRTVKLSLDYPFYRLGPDLVRFRFGQLFGLKAERHRVIMMREKR